MTRRWQMLAAAFGLLNAACGGERAETETEESASRLSMADWPGIEQRGTIRFARRAWGGFETLPSQGLPTEHYQRLAERFAQRHGLTVDWVVVPHVDGLFRSLEEGRADIAVWNLTVTESRQERVAFSLPLTRSREWVIGATETGRFAVAHDTAYVELLDEHYPDAPRVPVPADTDPMGFQELIESGTIDATIMDEALARTIVATSHRIDKLRELPEARDHAWALRRGNPRLKEVLDAYLLEAHTVEERVDEPRDWDAIVGVGRLRMLTVNQPTTYYLWRGERLGFEYELVQSFAAAHGLALEVVVAPDMAALMDGLAEGSGDVIAASLVRTEAREAMGLRFTRPYLLIRETFVTTGEPVTALADLAGRRITVNPLTSYAAMLAGLGPDPGFEVEHRDASTTAILDAIISDDADVSLVDSHRAQLEATFEPRLSLGLAMEPEKGLRWAVRENNGELAARLDAFIERNYRGYDFNVLRNKYFRNLRRMARQREDRVVGDVLSPYDDIVKRWTGEHGLDWRLVVAQMYQESGFDPDQVSFAGAEGLLQVLPRTAREMGFDPEELNVPETGIRAGVAYLAWTRERFPGLPVGERLWFALGAYNAGVGHVRDGRRLARELRLDDSLWFDNVEQAMLKLAEPEYASRATYGYVRGSEVVRYVREIRDRHGAYVEHLRLIEP